MAAIHNIELDLFARTPNGEEISLGKVELPITIDVNPRRPSSTLKSRQRVEVGRRAITPEEFDNLGHDGGQRP